MKMHHPIFSQRFAASSTQLCLQIVHVLRLTLTRIKNG